MQFAGAPTAQQVAQALTDGGLAAAIAADIAASPLAGNTANSILTTGVKVIDVPVIMDSTLRNLANLGTSQFSGDTSEQQSLIIEMDWGGSIVPAVLKYVEVRIAWSNGEASGFSGLDQTIKMHYGDDRGNSAIRVPCLGNSVSITWTNNTGATISFRSTVIGSQRAADKILVDQVIESGAPWANPYGAKTSENHLSTGAAAITPLGVGTIAAFPPVGGTLQVTVSPNATTTAANGRFALLDNLSARIGNTINMPAGTGLDSTITWTTYVGFHPVFLRCDVVPTGPTGVFVTAAWI